MHWLVLISNADQGRQNNGFENVISGGISTAFYKRKMRAQYGQWHDGARPPPFLSNVHGEAFSSKPLASAQPQEGAGPTNAVTLEPFAVLGSPATDV